jgi:membrane protease YdiL (CAAX protease family)
VILGAVIGIATAGLYLPEGEGEIDDAATLAILTLQGKLIAAADTIQPGSVTDQLATLDGLAATPAVARALAALNASVAGENGTRRARRLLELHRDRLDEADSPALHDAVLTAIDEPDRLSESEREQIRADMGWFGDLLLARDRPAGDPERREVLLSAYLTFAAAAALLVGAVLGLLAGLVLLATVLVLYFVRRAPGDVPAFVRVAADLASGRDFPVERQFERQGDGGAVYLQAFAVYLATVYLFQVGPYLLGLEIPWIGLSGILGASLIGLVWPVIRGVPAATAFRRIGLYRGQGVLKEIGCGLVGYLSILPILAAGFVMTAVLMWLPDFFASGGDEAPGVVSHPAAVWMAQGGWIVRLGVLFLAAVWAPFFEEALFRGAFQRYLRGRFALLPSALIISIIFAAIHPQGYVLVPALGALAFGFSLLREWRGSLIAPIVGHAVHNGALVAFMWVAFGS